MNGNRPSADTSRSETEILVRPDTQDVLITRIFNAPRELVFKMFTDPELIPQWWGPARYRTTVDAMQVRQGGVWRFVQYDPDGGEFAFHGVYHDVVPLERIVQTFEFEGMPGHVALETATFTDLGDRTQLTTRAVYQTVDDRDGMVSSGMEGGMRESHDRADALLQQLRARSAG